jgi:proteic killer suppression protein
MIVSFGNEATATIWADRLSRRLPPDQQAIALRKLRLINNARKLDDLRVPPGNRLEALRGDRRGQHSIRISAQWQICFIWSGNNAQQVEIVDDH